MGKNQIQDNILVHHLRIRRGKKYEMALKVDMNKAYDRVEWEFLEGVMRKIGFNRKWF